LERDPGGRGRVRRVPRTGGAGTTGDQRGTGRFPGDHAVALPARLARYAAGDLGDDRPAVRRADPPQPESRTEQGKDEGRGGRPVRTVNGSDDQRPSEPDSASLVLLFAGVLGPELLHPAGRTERLPPAGPKWMAGTGDVDVDDRVGLPVGPLHGAVALRG